MLKYVESFDHIGTTPDVSLYAALGWTSCPPISVGAGRFGSNAILFTSVYYSQNGVAFHLPTIQRKCNKLIVGFSVMNQVQTHVVFCYDSHVNFTISCYINSDGTLTIGMATAGSGYPAISTPVTIPFPYFESDYHFIELYLDVTDYKNGRAKVAVDGRTYVDKQGIVTADYNAFGDDPYDDRAKLNKVCFRVGLNGNQGYAQAYPCYFDSFYLADDQGGYQDDFLGDIFAKTFYPVADGTKRNWMPYVNGTIIGDENPHHELIDNAPIQPGDETEYLEADQDLTEEMVGFGTDPIPAGSELIAVNHRTMFRNVASPGSPKMNSLVPLFQMLGNPIVRTDSLSKKLTGWAYSFLDVYYNIVPVSAVLWEEYLLEQAEFGFMLRAAENLQKVEETLEFADEVIDE